MLNALDLVHFIMGHHKLVQAKMGGSWGGQGEGMGGSCPPPGAAHAAKLAYPPAKIPIFFIRAKGKTQGHRYDVKIAPNCTKILVYCCMSFRASWTPTLIYDTLPC